MSNCQIVNTDPRHCIGEYSHCLKILQCLLHCTDKRTSDVFLFHCIFFFFPTSLLCRQLIAVLICVASTHLQLRLITCSRWFALLLLLGSGLLLAPASDTAQYTLHNSHMGGPTEKYSSVISSEGALYVILPYDYQAHPLFEHTPVLNNNFEY